MQDITPRTNPWDVYQQALQRYGPSAPPVAPPPVTTQPNSNPLSDTLNIAGRVFLKKKLTSKAAAAATESAAPVGGMSVEAPMTLGEAQSIATGSPLMSVDASAPLMSVDTGATAAAAPEASGLMSSIGTTGPLALVAALAANSIYEGGGKRILQGKGRSDDWTNLALNTNPVTGWINPVLKLFGAHSIGRMMNTGKSDVQLARDSARSALINAGVADKNYLVNGFDIGKDGSAMLDNVGDNIDGNKQRHYYDVDFSNPLAKENVARVIPIVSQLLGQNANQKLQSDTVGMLMNSLTSGAKTQADFDNNFSNVFGGKFGIASKAPSAAPARSQTVSPGIRKDGTRISYSERK